MAHYAIGDIQGCFKTLTALLEIISFSPSRDTLWLAGDLVNRGPESLQTLRALANWGTSIQAVLGNHDIHLLALMANRSVQKKDDTLNDILNASDQSFLADWLRHLPLVKTLPSGLNNQPSLLVHAGILPNWSFEEALKYSSEFQSQLGATNWQDFLGNLFGNLPNSWSNNLMGIERQRVIVNICTRMRMIDHKSHALDFKFKAKPQSAPNNLVPWFNIARANPAERIIFGHWSALQTTKTPIGYCLDTGCVWGEYLTALCIDNDEIIQTKAVESLA